MAAGGVYTAYLYNGLGTRVGTTTGSVLKKLRRDGAGVTSSLLSDGSFDYNQGISRTSGSSVTSTHADMLGSLKLETNSSGGTTASRDYDAFGNLTSGSNAGLLGYAGSWGYENDSSGLQLLGHRWYDSFTGRFTTRDPAQDGRNWYDYADNDPLTGVDPAGLDIIVVKGDDGEVPMSGLGFWLDSPDADVFRDCPSKAELVRLLLTAGADDYFYFWGHGAGNGTIWVNAKETVTIKEIQAIARKRNRVGLGKLQGITLRACDTCQTAKAVNAWLELGEEVEGYTGLTAEPHWPPFNPSHSYRHSISYDPGRGMSSKHKKKKREKP